MPTLYLRHTVTKKKFLILSMNKVKNELVLQGEFASFTQPYDKEELQRLGYVLEKEEETTDDE